MTCPWPKLGGVQAIRSCLPVIGLLLVSHVFSADKAYPLLQIGSQTYSNVLVTGKNKQTIFIQHEKGIATLKAKDLPPQVASELGYAVADEPQGRFDLNQHLPVDPRVMELQDEAAQQIRASLARLSPGQLWLLAGVALLVYLFFCHCCRLICVKAGHKPGVLIWLPVLKIFPLLRAAGISGWCFLLCLVPIANVVLAIVWCLKICAARQKSPVLGVLLFLPVTNVIAFLYLAFSEGLELEDAPQRVQFS